MAYIKLDTSDFQTEFRKRVERSKRTLPQLINEATLQILVYAQRITPRGDLAAIEALGITYRDRSKTGKLLKRKKSVFNPTTSFKLIALKQMWKRGPSPRSFGSAQELDNAIRRQLSRRKSSISFVASGFGPAIKEIIRRVRGGRAIGADKVKAFPHTHGSAQPATNDTWEPYAVIEHATGMNAPGQTAVSQNRVLNELETAWRSGVDHVVEDWAEYAAKQLENAIHDEGA